MRKESRRGRSAMAAQLSLESARRPVERGGWRPGAGRPRGRRDATMCSHGARVGFSSRSPAHVTLRVAAEVPSLRQSQAVATVREAIAASHREGFRVLEFNVLANHIHLLVEADGQGALTEGMRGLNVRLARRLNRLFARRGPLLGERYHARRLTTPREVRNVLRYVLLNARHHAAERGVHLARGWVDPASSAVWFEGWSDPGALDRGAYWVVQLLRVPRPTRPPRTWLCIVGWRRHGLLGIDETPGGPAAE